jgi:hypothetical protein
VQGSLTLARASASEIFELAGAHSLQHDRIVMRDPILRRLRRALRRIIAALCDAQDEELLALAQQLQFEIAVWLTTPCRFDESIPQFLHAVLGSAEGPGRRWDRDTGASIVEAMKAADALAVQGNPLRHETGAELASLLARGRSFRVFCPRAARHHFVEAAAEHGCPPLEDRHFIHTAREYRDSPSFDLLVKVGPLRAHGIGSAPDALLSAPRFRSLLQFVWEGMDDDDDFGFDPATALLPDPPDGGPSRGTGAGTTVCGFRLLEDTVSLGSDADDDVPEDIAQIDDLRIVPAAAAKDVLRKAVLVQLTEDRGILYPRMAQVLAAGPPGATDEAPADRLAGEELSEGMFLILPRVEENENGMVAAEDGRHSRVWKRTLEERLLRDRRALVQRLRGAGIGLAGLDHLVEHWARPPTTVIHAPQMVRHFMILMHVLSEFNGALSKDLWKAAWLEVSRSRGEAIQAGVQEQERLHEKCLASLHAVRDSVSSGIAGGNDFNMPVPSGFRMTGTFIFMRIAGLEDGCRAPDRELRLVSDIDSLRRWLF